MNNIKSVGLICVRDELNIEYVVSKIEYVLNEDETFQYIFTPYYDVTDLLKPSIFQGIPGLELELRKEVYERNNILPTFISERVPSKKREDYNELLESLKLEYMDPIEYLIRTNQIYSGDSLYVKRFEERENIVIDEKKKYNNFGLFKIILDNIAKGNKVSLEDGTKINTPEVFAALKLLYSKTYKDILAKQQKGIEFAKENGKYKGRKPQKVDRLQFLEVNEKVEKGLFTAKEAAKKLGISIDKYYRFRKDLQNSLWYPIANNNLM